MNLICHSPCMGGSSSMVGPSSMCATLPPLSPSSMCVTLPPRVVPLQWLVPRQCVSLSLHGWFLFNVGPSSMCVTLPPRVAPLQWLVPRQCVSLSLHGWLLFNGWSLVNVCHSPSTGGSSSMVGPSSMCATLPPRVASSKPC